MVRDESGGTEIELEVWRLPASTYASFAQNIPAPLGIGKVELEDGTQVNGFICEPYGLEGATEISHHGGWRAYVNAKSDDAGSK